MSNLEYSLRRVVEESPVNGPIVVAHVAELQVQIDTLNRRLDRIVGAYCLICGENTIHAHEPHELTDACPCGPTRDGAVVKHR